MGLLPWPLYASIIGLWGGGHSIASVKLVLHLNLCYVLTLVLTLHTFVNALATCHGCRLEAIGCDLPIMGHVGQLQADLPKNT